jgi:hypothetical protein
MLALPKDMADRFDAMKGVDIAGLGMTSRKLAYARSGGYGALIDPSPTPTTTTVAPALWVRCQ